MVNKSKRHSLSLYSNLVKSHQLKKDKKNRERAEYLATLPKNPIKRFFYRLNPKRVLKFIFSKNGQIAILKFLGIFILICIIAAAGLFAYFQKDISKINLADLKKNVQTTVSRYYDRNGTLLWEDRGSGNYKLVVDSNELSDYLKNATVAIEDRDFYRNAGVSLTGTARALVNNLLGKDVQGGSTLTQQLIKQVFFSSEANDRGITGIPRKIKEMFLAMEAERMYSKDQILTLYLNESPYGGRRNGAESAAETYFGKSAKDLTIAEAALLAAIPQNPSSYNPYNTSGNKSLLARQKTVIDDMVSQGYIKASEGDTAKKVDILSEIKPESDQYSDMKAPHFVQMVHNQLVSELGASVVGKGGLTVTTTLDLRIQEKLESEMKNFFDTGKPERYNISDGAATVEDNQTGQIVAMLGSRDYKYPGFGETNVSTSFIQTGSTIKPFVYATLFKDKGSNNTNYGTGSILKDENINSIYGTTLNNWDNKFMGNLTVRQALALSRNIPAVEAMYIAGVQPALQTAYDAGVTSYCQQEKANGETAGLSSAIGACGAKETDLVNGYATFARNGVYKQQASILEVKNNSGVTLKKWTDNTSKQVIDPQISYMISDILGDAKARIALHGYNPKGLYVPGVKTAGKTGTSDKNGKPKDLWIVDYSTALTMGLWIGNADGQVITTDNSVLGGNVVTNVMEYAHTEIYSKENKWKSGDWFTKPSGIQTINGELYPSWYNKDKGQSTTKLTFDKVSKKVATSCTPDGAKTELDVTKTTDQITKKTVYIAPDGYDGNSNDDKHQCSDAKPSVSLAYDNGQIAASVSQGAFSVQTLVIQVDGKTVYSQSISGGGDYSVSAPATSSNQSVAATVTDTGYYTGTGTTTIPASSGSTPNGS